MSTDWDNGNPFAPDEDRPPDFFDRAAKYIVSSEQQPEPDEPEPSLPEEETTIPDAWEQPRSVAPRPQPDPGPPPEPAEAVPVGAPSAAAAGDEPLYTDDRGVPMLFDVVMTGDHCRAAELFLPRNPRRRTAGATEAPPEPSPPAPSTEDVEARIRQAIDAALPELTERTMKLLRESLAQEVHRALDRDQER